MAIRFPGMRFSIREVSSRRDLRDFIRYPLRLYRDDPCFVPHLLWERKQFFSPKNPIFEFTEVAYFLARDERGELAGRVTAHVNRRHNECWNEKTGFFGFFECVKDIEVARALMQAAEQWLLERGMTLVRGPFNFSTNEECGFLAEGFDKLPMFMMPYTKPYYLQFMEAQGYQPVKNLLAYDYSWKGAIPEYLVKFSKRVREKTGVTIRQMDLAHFEKDVETAFEIYNAAWVRNWGFVPMTAEEFRYAAETLKPILDPAVALIAEKDGRPVAFSLSLPNYNVLLKRMRGRILPLGPLYLVFGRSLMDRIRVIILGVIGEYRNRGIDVLLYHDTFYNGVLKRGYWGCEMSWVLEDNVMMNRAMVRMGAVVQKVYRVFEKQL